MIFFSIPGSQPVTAGPISQAMMICGIIVRALLTPWPQFRSNVTDDIPSGYVKIAIENGH
jgi:hypothetical protein